ncbi:acetate--CoA ligase [Sphingomonas carotinifaciens]|uniref:Acetyl-coenzyme A synthetase n=1 Tax=Sphingomonas carotinifaciens TaxID=1166323 RepID=A0A1G7FAX8_9SPHN|nr:acetate--CoA ligase [Sphingomonas carotinifaciens]MBB4085969.1 acetyl-CoA synthetase [Sphingomonas carotinifaciens]MWC45356.1 acetate--CoA ligase [Sphingomonas carotinifaciens]SDE73098.1 acetyl-coenzyme A synthetase [Sphingomonas carotinifaciens]
MTETIHAAPTGVEGSIDRADYERQYRASVEDSDAYWRDQAQAIDWITPFRQVQDTSFNEADFRIRWFADGELNVSVNCVDRHLATRGDQVAIVWEGDEPGETRSITYRELHRDVCRFANVLKDLGAKKGDRITLYLPMIAEAAAAMLACTRIGAIHSIVFGGFSPDSLANRIQDCDSRIVITADEGCRGGKRIPLKANVDKALAQCPSVEHVLVIRRTGGDVAFTEGRDIWLHDALQGVSDDCAPEPMNAEDPLFILYTSGSTGKPKGVLHTTGGYLVWVTKTFRDVFDYRDGEVYWCTADIGWVTGHSYVVYGPLANGATTVMFDGVPNYPDHARLWETIDRLGVNILYTAPTAIRALMREGKDWVTKYSRRSLRLLGTVGEPINPEAWDWYHRVVGDGRCPVVDTWWQTETGGMLIAPLPYATDLKPGSATKPLPGVQPQLVDTEGKVLEGATEGNLVIADSWPGQMRTVWGDHDRFFQTYFSTYPGKYFTGDGCRRDADGYYWITGRVDDVINVSGHRMGTAEVESALVAHAKVAEAAVVGMPHEVKGQGIYAYVTLNAGEEPSEELRTELRQWVRQEIGPIASPDALQFAPGLPKTRSGKIMRRILRKIAENDVGNLGDTSTLADPAVVNTLVAERVR